MSRGQPLLAAVSLASAVALAACGTGSSASTHTSATAARAAAPSGRPGGKPVGAPGAKPPGNGNPPTMGVRSAALSAAGPTGGGGAPSGSSATYTDTGAYTLNGGVATLADRAFTASSSDQSGVLVTSGTLTLAHPAVSTSGASKASDDSSFYGLDAGVLVRAPGTLTIIGGSVTTTGAGANGVFAYGSGSSVTVSRARISAGGQYAHGAMASGGGRMTLTNVDISTAGASSAAVATDRGGGMITVHGGSARTSGYRSPGIYSTGDITLTAVRMTATGAEAAVVEGANSITAIDDLLSGAKQHGVMLYNSMSGDAIAGTGSYTMRGGSLTAVEGPAFYVTNTNAVITISGGARITARSGVLVRADSAGTGSGNTGAGNATLVLSGELLTGNLSTGGTGTIKASLRNGTVLHATIDEAALTLDSSSVWYVTGDSTLSTLVDAGTISGSTITNVVGDGHIVTYDVSLRANRALGGKTYKLQGGGELKPA